MATISTDQQYVGVTLTITNKKGQPASVEGAPVWASSDPTVLSVTESADGMSGDIVTVAPGVARVTVTADANLDPNVVTTITGVTEDITVTLGTSAQASQIALTLPAPTDKP